MPPDLICAFSLGRLAQTIQGKLLMNSTRRLDPYTRWNSMPDRGLALMRFRAFGLALLVRRVLRLSGVRFTPSSDTPTPPAETRLA